MKKSLVFLLIALFLLSLTACGVVIPYDLPETMATQSNYQACATFPGPIGFAYAPLSMDGDFLKENFNATEEKDGVRLLIHKETEEVYIKASAEAITLYDMSNGGNLTAHYGLNGVLESAEYYPDWKTLTDSTDQRHSIRYSYTFNSGVLASAVMDTYVLTGPYDDNTMLSTTNINFDGNCAFSSGKHMVYTDGNLDEYALYTFNALGLKQSISYAKTGSDANGEYIVLGYYSPSDGSYVGCAYYNVAGGRYTYYNARGKVITVDELSKLIYQK